MVLPHLGKNPHHLSGTQPSQSYHTLFHIIMSEPFDSETFKFDTPQFDPRFPHPNQSKRCAQNYVDYHHCVAVKGEDYEPCKIFWKTFTSFCPLDWVEKWDDQREAGKFPVKIELK